MRDAFQLSDIYPNINIQKLPKQFGHTCKGAE